MPDESIPEPGRVWIKLFAAMAMQGILSICPPGYTDRSDSDYQDDARWLARRATMNADALLAALKEKS